MIRHFGDLSASGPAPRHDPPPLRGGVLNVDPRSTGFVRLRLTPPVATTRRSFGAKVARPARRFGYGPRFTGRAGFTLTELLVAVAIMAGMMTMVAMIFTTATRSSGQAQAMASLHRQVRQVAEGIRRDLASIDPASGIMGIVRVDVPAYLTQQDRDTDRTLVTDPTQSKNDVYRADVLMVVTPRTFKPYVYTPPEDRSSEYDCAFADRRLVVYGHADLGTLQTDGTWVTGATRAIEGAPHSPIPASQWHLARRIIGFAIDPAEVRGSDNKAGWPQFSLVDNRFTGRIGNTDQFADVYLSQADLFPTPSGHFRYNASNQLMHYYLVDSSGTYRYESSPPPPASPGYYLLAKDDTAGYLYWWFYTGGTDPWTRSEGGSAILPSPPNAPPWDIAEFQGTNRWDWTQWFYTGANSRSLLDPEPPTGLGQRLAHYYLPGCSEFRVEFTYDDPREIDIALDADEGYYRPRLIDWDGGASEPYRVPAPAPVRWQSVPTGERWVWSNLSTDPNPYAIGGSGDLRDLTQPYRWPRAIRITIRVHDPAGRLPEPITHTIVHAW